MNTIDKVLENLAKEVEIYGRSGADCVFLPDISFTLEGDKFDFPTLADIDGVVVDHDWFMLSAESGYSVPHPSPDKSFWLRTFGDNAYPYGMAWNLRALQDHLSKPENWRKAILWNPRTAEDPPCVICYQFMVVDHDRLNVTVTMRSSDVAKVLPQDVAMTWFLLRDVAQISNLDRGKMTFNIGNAHVYYEDCEWQEEFTIDGLD
tara:strand:- start:394 stop:1008 length:615 start_codon:yes stop_codon:yes gene_type:complete